MSRPPSRFSAGLAGLSKAAGREPAPEPAAPAPAAAPAREEPQAQPPSRQGKVAISAYFDPAVRKQLAILAVHQDASQAALLAEALNLLFEKHELPPIARA